MTPDAKSNGKNAIFFEKTRFFCGNTRFFARKSELSPGETLPNAKNTSEGLPRPRKSYLASAGATLTSLKSVLWSVPSFSWRRNYFEDAPEKSEDAPRTHFTCFGRFLRGTLFPWEGSFLMPYNTCCTLSSP